jgi:CIC family chloride channel protein
MADPTPRRDATTLAAATAQLRSAARLVSENLTAVGTDEQTTLLVFAGLIGTTVGLAVTGFYRLIDLLQRWVLLGALATPVSDYLLIPAFVALGILVCRAATRWGAGGSRGENVPDVMYRVGVKGGVIPLRPVVAKILASAVAIATGGSVGAEGPVIVLGAGAGSRIGRWVRASPNRLRTLAGCGAAAGISAAFNAPIAGVIFGIEKITGAAGGTALAPYVVSSILAATVSRALLGDQPVLALPVEYAVRSPWELVLYLALGVATGVVAVLYSRGVWRTQDFFDRLRSPWLQVGLGALAVGALNLLFREDLWGHGHESLNLSIVATRTAPFLLALAAAKLAATAITLGAGGVGGVFTPALFIGATLGGSLGHLTRWALPSATVAPGAVALVGMAGLVSGATHAPLTAIMMVFEMTGDYALILPLMLTSVLAYLVARRLEPESIYTEWLVRRGVVLSQGADAAVLVRITVNECYNRGVMVVPAVAGPAAATELTRASRQTEFPVVAGDGRLVGMLSREALREAAAEPAKPTTAGALASQRVEPVTPDDSVLTALRRLGAHDVEYLPVVSTRDGRRLIGIVSRHDLTAAYEKALSEERH